MCALSRYSSYQNCPRLGAVGPGAVIDRDDVAARAQAAFAGAATARRRGRRRRRSQSVSACEIACDHRVGQRVDRLGPVEA